MFFLGGEGGEGEEEGGERVKKGKGEEKGSFVEYLFIHSCM